jgi:hypothetical protein
VLSTGPSSGGNSHLGVTGHGDKVVGHCSTQQVGVLAVGALFKQNRSDALHDSAAHLLLHQERVDEPPAVVDRPVAEHADEACLAVDLDVARLHAVCHVAGTPVMLDWWMNDERQYRWIGSALEV